MSTQEPHGIISYDGLSTRRTDYLYRVSLKCLIKNDVGEVLVVKEAGRSWWDLPGGGMDHGESVRLAIAREMQEEVSLEGAFEYSVIAVDDPAFLEAHKFWQLRLIFAVEPKIMQFKVGADSDEIAFIKPDSFKSSQSKTERLIYEYSRLA